MEKKLKNEIFQYCFSIKTIGDVFRNFFHYFFLIIFFYILSFILIAYVGLGEGDMQAAPFVLMEMFIYPVGFISNILTNLDAYGIDRFAYISLFFIMMSLEFSYFSLVKYAELSNKKPENKETENDRHIKSKKDCLLIAMTSSFSYLVVRYTISFLFFSPLALLNAIAETKGGNLS